MNDTTIASLSGVILSLAFSYIPGLRYKYALLPADYKRLIMLGALLAVALGIYGASCTGLSQQVTCDIAGAQSLLGFFISAAIANQAAYMITPAVKG